MLDPLIPDQSAVSSRKSSTCTLSTLPQTIKIQFLIEVKDDRKIQRRFCGVHDAQDVIERCERDGLYFVVHTRDESGLMSRLGQSDNVVPADLSTKGSSSIQASFGFK
jgi:hypothetical protein